MRGGEGVKVTVEVEAEAKEIAALLLEVAARQEAKSGLDFYDAVQSFGKILDSTLKRNSVL